MAASISSLEVHSASRSGVPASRAKPACATPSQMAATAKTASGPHRSSSGSRVAGGKRPEIARRGEATPRRVTRTSRVGLPRGVNTVSTTLSQTAATSATPAEAVKTAVTM